MPRRMYLLKISLLGIDPEIWRRFTVPADITLDRLHDVIQTVMGWKDYHLHQFAIGKKRYTESPESEEDGDEEEKYRLGDLIKRAGRKFHYLYDFGDDWEHEIVLEDSDFILNDPTVPREFSSPLLCLEGKRACPPEDVGGVPGYYEFCEAVSDKKHPGHKEYTDWYTGLGWYGRVFKSEEFNADRINDELMKYIRWSRTRLLPWDAW